MNRQIAFECVLLAILIAVVCYPISYSVKAHARPDPTAQWNARMDAAIASQQLVNDALRTHLIYLRDGDAAGDLYVRCTTEPPRQPANISKCKTLLDRLQREDAKAAAAEAKEKGEW